MSYSAHRKQFGLYADEKALPKRDDRARKTGVVRRIIDAMSASRQRQVDQEMGQFLARSGGRLTDDLERQMTERLTTNRNLFLVR